MRGAILDRSGQGTSSCQAAGLPVRVWATCAGWRRPRLRESSEGFFSGYDQDPAPDSAGPGDSHYEMSAVFEDDDDSNFELPAFDPGAASLDEANPSSTFERASSEVLLPFPWYYNFIDSWSRFHFFVALGFGTSSLAMLGFFLVRSLVVGQIIDSSITTLIVGCVLTIAFVLLSVSATALIVLLVDS